MDFMTILAIILPLAILAGSAALAIHKQKRGMSSRKAFKLNMAVFAVMTVAFTLFAFTASAADAAPAVTGNALGMGYLAAALVTGLAGIGGGIAIAAGAPAAIGATSENPKMFGKAIIFCALGEAIAIYGLVISFMILTKLG